MWFVIQAEKYGWVSFSGAVFVPGCVKVGRFLQTWHSYQPLPFFFGPDLGRKIR